MARLFCMMTLAVLSIVALNVYIDPAHLIKSAEVDSDEAKIAGIMLDGKQVVVPREKIGFDERLSRRIFLERKKIPDTSVVFGSSRVRYLSSVAFNDKNHFVDAVNAATLEDLLTITYIRERFKNLPKTLVIALDPWMIEKANSYTGLVQVAYPGAFREAVEHFGFTLPTISQNIFKTEYAKSVSSGTNAAVKIPVNVVPLSSQKAGLFTATTLGTSPVTGRVQVGFDAMIEQGTYYWAWRVLVNGTVMDSGNYLSNLQGSPSPHEFRSVVTKLLPVNEGDAISVELAHASSDGNSVPNGNQKFHVKDFALSMKCSEPGVEKFKTWTNCDSILKKERLKQIAIVGKEMVSPAYFQQSLKIATQRSSESATLGAKNDCIPDANGSGYVFCADGSVPWPDTAQYDSERVESIVRTIDDGLVPLKEVDNGSLELLKQMTEYYKRNGTTVKYLLVPVHPYSYGKWAKENDSRGFVKAEKIYRDFAKANDVALAGSYDPNVVGCKNTDFRDWVHPLPRCTNLLVSALRPRMNHGSL